MLWGTLIIMTAGYFAIRSRRKINHKLLALPLSAVKYAPFLVQTFAASIERP